MSYTFAIHDVLSAVVRSVLERYQHYEWTVQGFGMLRTYLDKGGEFRLHIWHNSFKVPGVSTIHDHPWDFESKVVAGRVTNVRYTEVDLPGARYSCQKIKCGAGGGLEGEPFSTLLVKMHEEVYLPGNVYNQLAKEIHESIPEDGTVTIIKRQFGPDTEHARVFWSPSDVWVSAEPRLAASWEVEEFVQEALKRF